MQAGKLRHRVQIQAATIAQDAYGEPAKTWGTLYDTWASIEPLRMREYLQGQQTQAQTTHRIRIRWHDGIHTGMRVLHEGRVFELTAAINPYERGAALEFAAMEKEDYGTA